MEYIDFLKVLYFFYFVCIMYLFFVLINIFVSNVIFGTVLNFGNGLIFYNKVFNISYFLFRNYIVLFKRNGKILFLFWLVRYSFLIKYEFW